MKFEVSSGGATLGTSDLEPASPPEAPDEPLILLDAEGIGHAGRVELKARAGERVVLGRDFGMVDSGPVVLAAEVTPAVVPRPAVRVKPLNADGDGNERSSFL